MNTTERDDLSKEIEAAAKKYAKKNYEHPYDIQEAQKDFTCGANLLKARVERLENALERIVSWQEKLGAPNSFSAIEARAALEGKES